MLDPQHSRPIVQFILLSSGRRSREHMSVSVTCPYTKVGCTPSVCTQMNGMVEGVAHGLVALVQVTRDGMVHLAFHPMTQRLLLAAGDKSGHVGLWKADHSSLGNQSYLCGGPDQGPGTGTLSEDPSVVIALSEQLCVGGLFKSVQREGLISVNRRWFPC